MSEDKEMPDGWAWATIPEMIPSEGVFVDGDWIESKDQDPDGEVRLIQLADIGDGDFKNKSSRFLKLKRANALNCTFLRQNDILVARMPDPIGRACLFPLKNGNSFVTAVDVAIIRLGEKSVIPKYLMYSINNLYIRREIESLQSGTTRKRISRSNLAIIKFPLPPLPEQQRIVARIEELFSSLDKGIESLKTAQQQLKVYRQAVLKWAFEGRLTNNDVEEGQLPAGWQLVRIGDIANCIVPNRDKPKSFSGNIKWITTPNLNACSIRLDYGSIQIGLSKNEVAKYKSRVIPVGSVIMTCVGTFGLSAIVEEPIVINQQLHAFVANDKISSKYLAYCIQFNKNYFEKKSTSTTIRYLNKENCNSMPFPLCPLPEQHAIVAEIESRLSVCDKIEGSIEQSLRQSEALRQSILKKAFEGKLVPQDPNDEPASVLLERIKAEREKNKPENPSRRQAGKIKAKKAKS